MRKNLFAALFFSLFLSPIVVVAATCPRLVYDSQSGGVVTADYFGMPANTNVWLVNVTNGATYATVGPISGTSTVAVDTTTAPSGAYNLRAGTTTGTYIAQTVNFYVSNLVTRVGQANLAQGNVNGGGDGVFTLGNYAYIAEGSGTTTAFQIFNVSNPTAPVLVGQANLANGGNTVSTDSIWVSGTYAYIAEGGGTTNALEIFNVSNPAAPSRVSQSNLAHNAGDSISVAGNYAYIIEGGSQTGDFEIFNISNPAAPVRVSQSNTTAFDQASIYVQGTYAYIAIGGLASRAFDIFDVSNPAAPVLKSVSDLANGIPNDGIYVLGTYAYIAEGGGGTNGLQVFNVSNPSAPVLVGQADLANAGSIDTGGGDSIWVDGTYAYVVEGGGKTNAFQVFNISDPAWPYLETQSNLAQSAQPDSIYIANSHAYIAEGGGKTNAFQVFDLTNLLASGDDL